MTSSIEANEVIPITAGEQPPFDLAAHLAYLGDLAMTAAASQQQAAQLQQQLTRQLYKAETMTAEYNGAFGRCIRQLADPENGLDDNQRLQGLFDMLRTSKNPAWLDTFRHAQAYGTRLGHDEPIWINGRLHAIHVREAEQAPTVKIGHNPHNNRHHSGNDAPFTLHYLIWARQGSAELVQRLVSHLENPVGRNDIKTVLDAEYDSLRWTPHSCFDPAKTARLENLAGGYQALNFTGQAAACQELLDALNSRRPRPTAIV